MRRPGCKTGVWLLLLLLLALPLQAEEEWNNTLTLLDPPATAPDFTLNDMDGKTHRLSDYRGHVVLVNFWATWCPPCRKEMPSLERLYQQLREQSFIVLAVNQWETPDHVFSYMGELNVFPEFPILFDPESRISEEFGVRGLPTSFILDRQGRIRYRAIGGREYDHPQIVKLVSDLLDSKD